jgi:hypothetical protein
MLQSKAIHFNKDSARPTWDLYAVRDPGVGGTDPNAKLGNRGVSVYLRSKALVAEEGLISIQTRS